MGASGDVTALALSPSGKWLAVSYASGKLQVVDIPKNIYLLDEPRYRGFMGIRAMLWVAGGKILVTAGAHGVRFWDPAAKSKPMLATLRFTSDGWFLVTSKQAGGGLARTAGNSRAVVSDVCLQRNETRVSGGLLWEGRRDDRILGHLLHCGRASCSE